MDRTLFHITPSGAAGLLFAAFCFGILPAIAGSYWLSILTSAACFAMAASGVAFIYARLGMVSLTQVGLMGVGGWVMLRLNYLWDLPFEANLLLASIATMICGWIMALPALRLRGLYLALVTLMAAGGLEIIFATFQFPNGGPGFWGVQIGGALPFRGPVLASTPAAYLRYVVVLATLGFVLIEAHRRMAPGRAWALIRRSEAAAMAAGVNVTLYKTWAFGIAGLLAGAAGALLAGSLGLLDDGTFRAPESIMLFALAVVGGARYWLGAVIAAFLYRVLPAALNTLGVDSDLAFVIFGAGLLHALITAPNGIAGQIMGLVGRITAFAQGKGRRHD
jgi:branched-chain amino acid transport system permease protein